MKRDIWFLTVLSLSMLVGCQDDFDRGVPVTTVAGSAEAASFQGGQDWPQWRGIRRDGVSPEAGLGRSWPEGGPTEIWRRAIGTGYSGIVVSRNQLYTLDQNGDERLLAMSAENGREIWFLSFGGGFSNSQGDGPRGTPAADGELVFAVSGSGTLVAADRSTGRQVWKHDLPREFHSSSPNWGFATSPLVRGDLVLVEPGGQGGGSLAAFQKRDGELVWSSHSDPAGYSSPLAVEFEGQRQILFFTARHLLSVTPEQGRVLWQVSWTTSHDVNAATPIWIPPDRVFISSDYDVGGAVFEMGAFEWHSPAGLEESENAQSFQHQCLSQRFSVRIRQCHAEVHRRLRRIHEVAGERVGTGFSDFRRRDVDRPGGKRAACPCGGHTRSLQRALTCPGAQR